MGDGAAPRRVVRRTLDPGGERTDHEGVRLQRQELEERGWWARNWTWAIPTGCLGMLVIIAAGLVGLTAFGFSQLKESWVFSESTERVRSDPRAVEALGEPIEVGWKIRGDLHLEPHTGDADLSLPVEGPDGRGRLHVVADRPEGGEWSYDLLELRVEGRDDPIDLLSAGDP